MSDGFLEAFERTLGHEGGYVHNPADPGGETKFGMSKRSHPHVDIKALTIDQARDIYRREYWGPAGCDALPLGLRAAVFDASVHAGPRKAIQMLQAVVGETQDGILGPRTLQAVNSMPQERIRARLEGARLEHLTSLPTWPAFGRGWARRIAANLLEA